MIIYCKRCGCRLDSLYNITKRRESLYCIDCLRRIWDVYGTLEEYEDYKARLEGNITGENMSKCCKEELEKNPYFDMDMLETHVRNLCSFLDGMNSEKKTKHWADNQRRVFKARWNGVKGMLLEIDSLRLSIDGKIKYEMTMAEGDE